jgi:hypothetical protein
VSTLGGWPLDWGEAQLIGRELDAHAAIHRDKASDQVEGSQLPSVIADPAARCLMLRCASAERAT